MPGLKFSTHRCFEEVCLNNIKSIPLKVLLGRGITERGDMYDYIYYAPVI